MVIKKMQIIKVNGRNTFFEIKNDSFDFNKVYFNFIEYDITKEKSNRIMKNVVFYLDIEDFLLFANDVLSGRMNALANQEKQNQEKKGGKYYKEVWNKMGGTSAIDLKRQNRERVDGKSESRQIKLAQGIKSHWVLSAEMGAGETNETGLIIPRYNNGKPEAIVRVPMTNEDLKKMVLIVKAHLESYLTSLYITDPND